MSCKLPGGTSQRDQKSSLSKRKKKKTKHLINHLIVDLAMIFIDILQTTDLERH